MESLEEEVEAVQTATLADVPEFSAAMSTDQTEVFEVLPGPAAFDSRKENTPFSNQTAPATGFFALAVNDATPADLSTSDDSVMHVDIRFTDSEDNAYLIEQIEVIHKEPGSQPHPFFGGIGTNEIIHGDTGIGTNLMPEALAYISFWGVADITIGHNGDDVVEDRLIHIMVTNELRDENRNLIPVEDIHVSEVFNEPRNAHVLLPPQNLQGEKDPIPNTPHGFLHMNFTNVDMFETYEKMLEEWEEEM